jgi:hypothetical protein
VSCSCWSVLLLACGPAAGDALVPRLQFCSFDRLLGFLIVVHAYSPSTFNQNFRILPESRAAQHSSSGTSDLSRMNCKKLAGAAKRCGYMSANPQHRQPSVIANSSLVTVGATSSRHSRIFVRLSKAVGRLYLRDIALERCPDVTDSGGGTCGGRYYMSPSASL